MNRSTYSLVQRLLPWWSGGFDPFLHLASDYSIPLIALKGATFDEFAPGEPLLVCVGMVLLLIGALLTIAVFVGILRATINLRSKPFGVKAGTIFMGVVTVFLAFETVFMILKFFFFVE